ncbi:MAG: hypothetical protein N2234_04455, partial [Planctomycetota bacterium]|nr:hypothetical protein [Planctomycetota bacterium]
AGVTLALTTALNSTSAPKWLVWDGLVSFLRWMLDHVLRKTSEGDWWFDVQTSEKGTVFLLSAPSASEPLKNGRLLIGNRYFPLLPRTPSVYEAEASLEGDISSVLLVEDEGKIVATISVNILNSEKRVVENNVARLKRIVSDCGGELLSSVDFLNHSPVGWRMGKTGLWRYLILISLLCLVLSLLLRFLHLRR